MSYFLCCEKINENSISCSNCNIKFNILCIAKYTVKYKTDGFSKCPQCKELFFPNENIYKNINFTKIGFGNVQLLLDFGDIILENMNITHIKNQRKKYKYIYVFIMLINLLSIILLYFIFS